MQRLPSPLLILSGLLFAGGLYLLHYHMGRWQDDILLFDKGTDLVLLFLVLFGLYFGMVRQGNTVERERWLTATGILVRAMLVFCLPILSDDFYRFCWDGHLQVAGQDALQYLPDRMWKDSLPPVMRDSEFWQKVYAGLNSREYYTVYPPALQGVFALAARIAGQDLWGMVVIMKSTILLAEMGSIWFLRRLLRIWGRPVRWALLYTLNPLVISEMVGNLHFEAFMLCFTLLGVWWLVQWSNHQTAYGAALPFALAIASKLLPVMFFPFLIRRLGWGRSIVLGVLTAGLTALLFVLAFDPQYFPNFLTSVGLYFAKFEFNGGPYLLLRTPLGDAGYLVNRFLPWIVPIWILWRAYRDQSADWSSLPLQLLCALTLYQIVQPVIHPWYIVPLVGLAALTRYRFAILWSLLLPLTYTAYFFDVWHEARWILWLEYGLLLGFIFFEWQFKAGQKTLEDWVRERPGWKRHLQKSIPARMAIKLERIARYIPGDHTVIDIGTGNGGLCRELRKKGYQVQPVDVQNISFFEDVEPVIYDGTTLPFAEENFDTSLLITVLHHIPDQERVLDEAIRVAKHQVIVMEDIFRNPLQKHLTFFTDSLVNLEFAGHPHTNRTGAGWQKLFTQKGLKLVEKEEFRTLLFFRQVIYVLEK